MNSRLRLSQIHHFVVSDSVVILGRSCQFVKLFVDAFLDFISCISWTFCASVRSRPSLNYVDFLVALPLLGFLPVLNRSRVRAHPTSLWRFVGRRLASTDLPCIFGLWILHWLCRSDWIFFLLFTRHILLFPRLLVLLSLEYQTR